MDLKVKVQLTPTESKWIFVPHLPADASPEHIEETLRRTLMLDASFFCGKAAASDLMATNGEWFRPFWFGRSIGEVVHNLQWLDSLDYERQQVVDLMCEELDNLDEIKAQLASGNWLYFEADKQSLRSLEEQFGRWCRDTGVYELPEWALPYFDFKSWAEDYIDSYYRHVRRPDCLLLMWD